MPATHSVSKTTRNPGKEAVPSFFESLYTQLTADANEITDGVFLGAYKAGEDKKAMQRKRISHVLLCHPTLKEHHADAFKYSRAPMADDPTFNLLEHLPDALEYLGKARAAGGRVFVCCAKGISRSSSIICALLMLERGITFEAAFKACEQKRPVVYPNVGFQLQLRHVEALMAQLPASASWGERLKHLREHVPGGILEGPKSPLQIRELIGQSMGAELDELESLAERVLRQPQLLQQREIWKRHGLFFENCHKYKALPSDSSPLARTKEVMDRLRGLPKIFSDTLKGVKLALAVAKEMESWSAFARPALERMEALTASMPPAVSAQKRDADEGAGAVAAGGAADAKQPAGGNACSSSSSSSSARRKKKKGQGKEGKLSKKELKKMKKEKKQEKKIQKAAKKAEKLAAKIERDALEASKAADATREAAERAAERADVVEKELAAAEAAEEEAKANKRGAKRRRSKSGSDERSSSSSSAGRRTKPRRGRSPPRRPVAADAYRDLDE